MNDCNIVESGMFLRKATENFEKLEFLRVCLFGRFSKRPEICMEY